MTSIAIPTGPLVDNPPSGQISTSWRYFFLALRDGLIGTPGAAGYQRFPSGVIMQWGNATTVAGGGFGVIYPIVFPHACWSFQATILGAGGPLALTIAAGVPGAGGVNVFCANSTNGAAAPGIAFAWQAIGS